MDQWKGKLAIVVGASVGIGASILETLAQQGMKVVGMARRKEKIEEMAKNPKNKAGKIYAVKVDCTVEDELIKAFKWTKDNLGPVHVLVNNAGVLFQSQLMDGETKYWRRTIDVNLMSYIIATREAIKQMQDAKIDGQIIFINSILGHYVPNLPLYNMYSCSKYALTAAAETLRVELNHIKSKIKVTDLSPGVVKTSIFEDCQDVNEFYEGKSALEPVDVANAVLYILSTPPSVHVYEMIVRPINASL